MPPPALPARAHAPSRPAHAEQPQPAGHVQGQGTARLRYTQQSPVYVAGPITGRRYEFSGTHPIHTVDARDVTALLRSGFFTKV